MRKKKERNCTNNLTESIFFPFNVSCLSTQPFFPWAPGTDLTKQKQDLGWQELSCVNNRKPGRDEDPQTTAAPEGPWRAATLQPGRLLLTSRGTTPGWFAPCCFLSSSANSLSHLQNGESISTNRLASHMLWEGSGYTCEWKAKTGHDITEGTLVFSPARALTCLVLKGPGKTQDRLIYYIVHNIPQRNQWKVSLARLYKEFAPGIGGGGIQGPETGTKSLKISQTM